MRHVYTHTHTGKREKGPWFPYSLRKEEIVIQILLKIKINVYV